jgi:hypothetical protein
LAALSAAFVRCEIRARSFSASAAKRWIMNGSTSLAEIMNDPEIPPAARVAAANAILDRGWGRPKQPLEGAGENGAFVVQVVNF